LVFCSDWGPHCGRRAGGEWSGLFGTGKDDGGGRGGREGEGSVMGGMADDGHMSEAGPGGEASLARAVRARREALGLTLAEVAQRVPCAKSYLSALENQQRAAPSDELLAGLERALEMAPGALLRVGRWSRSLEAGGATVREDLEAMAATRDAARRLAGLIREAGCGRSLDALHASGALRRLVEQLSPGEGEAMVPVALGRSVPLINKVAAGYPTEFTDLSYPARVADEYVRCPDVTDADAFAARVVGDSMSPSYLEGDVVVFSPAKPVADGQDCFVRLEPDHQTTFKRVYFEEGGMRIRLQPLNSAYPPRVVEREGVAGLYAAVAVIKRV
jgi:repressor LexA